MSGRSYLRILTGIARLAVEDERASQMVEFAVALPLLVVFVVGIFDFSGAFTIKQKLTNLARDAARASAAEPGTDLAQPQGGHPASVRTAFQIVQNYFAANNLNLCGAAPSGSTGLKFTYHATISPCPSGLLNVIIHRGYYFPAGTGNTPPDANCTPQAAGTATAVIATCVSIQYSYTWKFGQVAGLFGSSMALPATITATAVAMNED